MTLTNVVLNIIQFTTVLNCAPRTGRTSMLGACSYLTDWWLCMGLLWTPCLHGTKGLQHSLSKWPHSFGWAKKFPQVKDFRPWKCLLWAHMSNFNITKFCMSVINLVMLQIYIFVLVYNEQSINIISGYRKTYRRVWYFKWLCYPFDK